MSKVHPEAFTEWTATADLASTNGTANGQAARASVRHFVTYIQVSFSTPTATSVGTIVVNFGAASTLKVQAPVGATGNFLQIALTKAFRCDTNFQPTVVLAGFTAGPVASVNICGYSVRE